MNNDEKYDDAVALGALVFAGLLIVFCLGFCLGLDIGTAKGMYQQHQNK